MRHLLARLILVLTLTPFAATHAIVNQTPDLAFNEAQTVYLTNLQRRNHDLPPLRWNRQLTEASRWFAWDSTENRAVGFCGHQDSQEHWPDWRAAAFGYKGQAGSENAYCGYLSPQQAVDGWMNSPGHRANILQPDAREIGLGYYRRASDGRGYVAQMFGTDAVYPPVIIDNEAPSTTNPQVRLYIYTNPVSGDQYGQMGPITQMQISNDSAFTGATWQPYSAEPLWNLAAGVGWRTVYVKLSDAVERTIVVQDTIYLGSTIPVAEIGFEQMSSTAATVTVYGVNSSNLPQVQWSLGWFADDSFGTFNHMWGNIPPQHFTDPTAWGGTAARIDASSPAWVWTTNFFKDVPLVAYVRVKTNTIANGAIGEFSITSDGDTEQHYGPITIRGEQFTAPDQYREFALPFVFRGSDGFLEFKFFKTGTADFVIDGVSIFTAPQPVQSPLTVNVPGANYRAQGVWLRYTDGANQFSDISTGSPHFVGFNVSTTNAGFLVEQAAPPPASQTIAVNLSGNASGWTAQENAAWLGTSNTDNQLTLTADHTGLALGPYSTTVTLIANDMQVAPQTISVNLLVVEELTHTFLPFILR